MLLCAGAARAQTTSFSYQGRLTDGGTAANGNYDLQFALFDSAAGGAQIGATQTVNTVAVSAGIFTVSLDFGANAFPGANRFLEIGVRLSGGGAFTTLSPRQPISSTPYAIRSANATTADTATTATNATQLGGVAAGQYVVTSDLRLTDSRAPTAGSANYVQNTTSQQPSSNFNVSGNGALSGSLGIGTNSPTDVKLEAAGNMRIYPSSGPGSLQFRNRTSADYSQVVFLDDANTYRGYLGYIGSNAGLGSRNNALEFGSNGTDISFQPNNTEVMRLSTNGRVGIGTTNPTSKLSVNGGSNDGVGGYSTSSGTGVAGSSDSGNGVLGYSTSGYGVYGLSTSGYGVYGFSGGNYAGYFNGHVAITGRLVANALGSGGTTSLCRNASNEIATCSSSLRYKTEVQPFSGGLEIINRLRPIAFTWKQGGTRDIGLGAEEVQRVEPLLTFRNAKGETEGVKYDRLSAVFINAFKEQQQQIDKQQQQIERQQKQIATLLTSNAALNSRLRGVEKSLRKKAGSARRR
jgi:hypothetical protein